MTTSAPSLEIVISPSTEGVSLRVRGEIDISNVRVLEDAVDAAADAESVVVDLSGTTFVDLGGLAALARCSRRRAATGREMTVLDPPLAGEKILRCTALGEQLRWRHVRRIRR